MAGLPVQRNAAVDGLALAAERHRDRLGVSARIDRAGTEDV